MTGAIASIAFLPRWGSELWADSPSTVIRSAAPPLWPWMGASWVGSDTTNWSTSRPALVGPRPEVRGADQAAGLFGDRSDDEQRRLGPEPACCQDRAAP